MLLAVSFDPDTKKIRTQMDGGTTIETTWTGDEDPTDGDLVMGARLLDGIAQSGGNFGLLRMLAATQVWTSDQHARAARWAVEPFAPVCRPLIVEGTPGLVQTIDLTPVVQDPAGWGWWIVAVDQPAGALVTVVDERRVTVDLTGLIAGEVRFRAQVASKHPLEPSSPLEVLVLLEALQLQDLTTTVIQATPTTLDVLQGATDSQGRVVSLISVGDAEHGTVRISGNRAVYTGNPGYLGPDSFTFTGRSPSGALGLGTAYLTVEPDPTGPPPGSEGTINVGANNTTDLMDVLWRHMPGAADITAHNAQKTEDARQKWLDAYIRRTWAGRGSVSIHDDHYANTIANTKIAISPDGKTPCYSHFRRRRRNTSDPDPQQWRASQIGVPWKRNGGFREAAVEFKLWMPADFNNYLNDPKLNPDQIGAMFKLFWLFWGGPWRGAYLDDVTPTSGGDTVAQMGDWSIRAQCQSLNRSKGQQIGYKGYCYIVGREATGEKYGFGTRYSQPFLRDAWNVIKAYCRVNTISNGVANYDGVLRLWLNETEFYNSTTLNIRGNHADWLIQGCGPMHYFGGQPGIDRWRGQKNQFLYLTDFKMAGR